METEATKNIKVASEPFDEATTDAILRSSDGVDFHVYRAILAVASPFFKAMFTLNQPPALTEEDTCGNAGPNVIHVAEDSDVLDTLLRLCYPVRDPVISESTLLGHVLEAAIKYDMDEATCILRKNLSNAAKEDPLHAFAIACHLRLEEEALLAASAYKTQQKTWLETEMKEEGVAMSFEETLPGHVFCPCLAALSAGAYHRLLRFLRKGETAPLCKEPTTTSDHPSQWKINQDDHAFSRPDGDLTLKSLDGVEFRVHRLILRLASAEKLLGCQEDSSLVPARQAPPVIDVALNSSILDVLLQACYPPLSDPKVETPQHMLSWAAMRVAKDYEMEGVLAEARSTWSQYVRQSPCSAYFTAVELGWTAEATEAARELCNETIEDIYVSEMESVLSGSYQALLDYRYRCYSAIREASFEFYKFKTEDWHKLMSSKSISHCLMPGVRAPTIEFENKYNLEEMKRIWKNDGLYRGRVTSAVSKVTFDKKEADEMDEQ